jgi:hypothetical protein
MSELQKEAVEILEEQLANEGWNGDPPIALGDHMATSLSRDSNEIAIAMSGGWWVLSFEEVRQLQSHIPKEIR